MVATKISSIIPVALFGVTDRGVNPTVTATVVLAPTASRTTILADPALRPSTFRLLPTSETSATVLLLVVAV
jgi:hypothetical protein